MDDPVPPRVREYAEQTVSYVRNALGVTIGYDSETLPVLDHYLRTVNEAGGTAQPATIQLVIATAGAYFGEVVRRRLGGRWELSGDDIEWRMVLPTGLNFAPAGFVAAAIAQADLDDLDSELDAPPRMRPYVQQALSRMGEVSFDDYYSLCGRLDTLEHVHEVLVAVAAQMMGDEEELDDGPAGGEVVVADDPDAEPPGEPDDDDDDAPEPVTDEPSGSVN